MKKMKVFYAEDDGGSFLISPVDSDIKSSLRNVITYLERAHGIKAQKASTSVSFSKKKCQCCLSFVLHNDCSQLKIYRFLWTCYESLDLFG